MKSYRMFVRWAVSLSAILCLGVLFVTCSDDSTGPARPVPADTDAYLATLPAWDEFADVQDTATEPAGDVIAEMSNQVLCATTPFSITQNPDAIITFGSAPDVLYLGSLIQGDSYLGGLGTMEELPIRQRAPLTIAINLFTGTDISAVVPDPNAATVQSALNTLVSNAASSGHQSGSRISYNYKESFSAMQAALSLDLSFKYMTSSGKAALDFSMSESSHTITALFKQIMFEAYIVRPQTPGQFFSNDFTQERLDEQINLGNIGPNNLPVYVARIQYGRMLMYSMTTSEQTSILQAAIEASYNGVASVDGSIRTRVESVLQNAEVKVATIGGEASSALALLRSGQLKDYFTTNDPITTAAPLAYALCNLADGSLAQVSEMTSYSIKQCGTPGATAYTNKTEWQMAIASMVGDGHIVYYPTTAENIALSNEETTPPASNHSMGAILTFDSSRTHYPFTFRLRALASGHTLVFQDQESGPAFGGMDQARGISIGDVDDGENDDFEIAIPVWHNNAAVFAIGISICDNNAESGEGGQVYGVNGFADTLSNSRPSSPGIEGFLGIIATVPITSIRFNESDTGDDMFVRDFCFGVLTWNP